MFGRLRLSDDVPDHALCIDQKRGTDHAHVLPSVHRFLPPDPIGLQDLLVGIGQQGERQFVFGDEFLMTGFVIRTDPNNSPAFFDEFLMVIPQITGLHCAGRCHILRIEIQYQFLSLEGAQPNGFPVLISGRKSRRFLSLCQRRHNNGV